jgi:hypothetical protein
MVWLQIFLFYDSKPAICGHFLVEIDTSRQQVLGQTNMEGCKIIIMEVIQLGASW